MFNRFIWLVVVLAVITSCKTGQKVTQTTPPSVAEPVTPIDTTEVEVIEYFITTQGDTLQSVMEEVELEISRLLPDTFSILGVGDIMSGTDFPESRYLPGDNGRWLWEEVNPLLQDADLTFGNLEGVILDEGGTPKRCGNPKVCYLFKTPESYVQNFVDAGFDVMSLANNHAGDFGSEGRANTRKVLDSIGIAYAGHATHPYAIFKQGHVKIGFTAFSPNTGTLSIHDYDQAAEIIGLLDSLSDIVVVSFHGGAEGKKHQHVTRERETFYGENRGNVYEFAHMAIDNGADVIFGHGPHVTRAIDLYKDRFIIYSLGNFCTYGRFNLRGENGIAPIIKLAVDSQGKFLQGEVIPIKQIKGGQPIPDPEGAAIKKIQELTASDFPEIQLSIGETGLINYLEN